MGTPQLFDDLTSFVEAAGKYALQQQSDVTPDEKADKTVVSKVDLNISKMFADKFNHYFESGEHVIIDEESVNGKTPDNTLKKQGYVWTLDPIDGTANFIAGTENWGILIAIFKDGQPFFACNYMPRRNLMYWVNETEVLCIRDPFGSQKDAQPLQLGDNPYYRHNLVVSHMDDYQKVFGKIGCLVEYWASATDMHYMLSSNLGFIIHTMCAIWDDLPAAVFYEKIGYKSINLKTREPVDWLAPDTYQENWRFAQPVLYCHPDNLDKIMQILSDKGVI